MLEIVASQPRPIEAPRPRLESHWLDESHSKWSVSIPEWGRVTREWTDTGMEEPSDMQVYHILRMHNNNISHKHMHLSITFFWNHSWYLVCWPNFTWIHGKGVLQLILMHYGYTHMLGTHTYICKSYWITYNCFKTRFFDSQSNELGMM